jgi:hypothetical protein
MISAARKSVGFPVNHQAKGFGFGFFVRKQNPKDFATL